MTDTDLDGLLDAVSAGDVAAIGPLRDLLLEQGDPRADQVRTMRPEFPSWEAIDNPSQWYLGRFAHNRMLRMVAVVRRQKSGCWDWTFHPEQMDFPTAWGREPSKQLAMDAAERAIARLEHRAGRPQQVVADGRADLCRRVVGLFRAECIPCLLRETMARNFARELGLEPPAEGQRYPNCPACRGRGWMPRC